PRPPTKPCTSVDAGRAEVERVEERRDPEAFDVGLLDVGAARRPEEDERGGLMDAPQRVAIELLAPGCVALASSFCDEVGCDEVFVTGVVEGLDTVAVESPAGVQLASVPDNREVEGPRFAVDVGEPYAPLDDADLGRDADFSQVVLNHLARLDVGVVRLRQWHVEGPAVRYAGFCP